MSLASSGSRSCKEECKSRSRGEKKERENKEAQHRAEGEREKQKKVLQKESQGGNYNIRVMGE